LGISGASERHRLTGDLDFPLRGTLDLRENLHQGRLAGPVLPGHRVDLAGQDLEIHPVHGLDARELL
jgi:hypothetical protein